jgi:protein TonB
MPKFALRRFEAGLASLLLHTAAIVLVFTFTASDTVRNAVRNTVRIVLPPDDSLHVWNPKAGGGGGGRSPLPASQGRLPRAAERQFTPPSAVRLSESPKLLMEPALTIVGDVKLPQIELPDYGDPLGRIGPPSDGPGSGGGIGTGHGQGVGPGDGPGVGPGSGGGVNGFRAGGRRSPLTVLSKVEPDYSDDARKAQLQGTVIVELVVDEQGMPRNLKVVRSLGLGLDERALEAVSKWRFRPAYRDGKPSAAPALVEVTFRLL